MAIFGRRKPQSFTELKETMRPTPDADGVTRVFPKELWDDPKIGQFLREVGFAPDDARSNSARKVRARSTSRALGGRA